MWRTAQRASIHSVNSEDGGSKMEDGGQRRRIRRSSTLDLRSSTFDRQCVASFEIEQAFEGASEYRPRLFFAGADPAQRIDLGVEHARDPAARKERRIRAED